MMSSVKLSPYYAVTFLVLLLSILRSVFPSIAVMCIEAERQALLSFRRDLHPIKGTVDGDPLGWVGTDCCNWYGILCSNDSRHVESLSIDVDVLGGKLSPSLFELTHLTHLCLYSVNLSLSQIPSCIGKLSNLRQLIISSTHISGSIPAELGNLSRLERLKLSDNNLQGAIPKTFYKLYSLKDLDLGHNQFNGLIPNVFSNMSALESIYLLDNMFGGKFPKFICNISSMRGLRLGSNKFHGNIPEAMSTMKHLRHFGIAENLFEGEITEAHFVNLSMLESLDFSSNLLSLKVHSNWSPPFKLSYIRLGSCMLGPQFPRWLQTQTSIFFLDLSNTGISDSIPSWFWFVTSDAFTIDLSDNQISGGIENYNISSELATLDLSSNRFEGSIPSFFTQFSYVNLLQNRFSKINLFCNINIISPLTFLDISNNELSGELPDCWSPFEKLEYLILSNNSFSDRVPLSLGSLSNIKLLKLEKNYFLGPLPWTLQNCKSLHVFDIAENKLSGAIPVWFGQNLSNLVILSLRHNSFSGGIPSSLCHLSNLTVLDLSSNNFIGSIPNCISSFRAMIRGTSFVTPIKEHSIFELIVGVFEKKLQLVWKGGIVEFKRNLPLLRIMDLSNNKLNGEIPREITELSGLLSLNLSRNNLCGKIPTEIGRMESLDALDLSRNCLIGEIPQSLAQVDRLNTLDLSNNNLFGKIPTSTQLQSLENAYWGNIELCGDPLPNKCPVATLSIPGAANEDSDLLIGRGFYISMVIGFTTAFWGVCGFLIFIKSFRYAYFKLSNEVGDWIYVKTTIQHAKVMRIIKD